MKKKLWAAIIIDTGSGEPDVDPAQNAGLVLYRSKKDAILGTIAAIEKEQRPWPDQRRILDAAERVALDGRPDDALSLLTEDGSVCAQLGLCLEIREVDLP